MQDTEIEYMAEAARRQQTTETIAKLYDGKLRLERRNGSPEISVRTFLQGKNVVFSTKEQTLPAATKVPTPSAAHAAIPTFAFGAPGRR